MREIAMRVLLTGGCGFVGSAVAEGLLRQGAQILNVDKMTPSANPLALRDWKGSTRYQVVEGDSCDMNLMLDLFEEFQPDQVIHCAAESHRGSAFGNSRLVQTNFIGTFTLLEAARTWWAGRRGENRFQLIATDDVYGEPVAGAGPANESMSFRPQTPTAATRAAACHLATAWAETYGLPVVATICSDSFGPWQMPEKMIPAAITRAAEGRKVPVLGPHNSVRNWTHIRDQAHAIRLVQEHGKVGEIYNISSNCDQTNANVVQLICKELDRRIPENAPHNRMIEVEPDVVRGDDRRAMDSTKIWNDLRWRPETELRQGLAETVQWYLANRPWWKAARRRMQGARMEAA